MLKSQEYPQYSLYEWINECVGIYGITGNISPLHFTHRGRDKAAATFMFKYIPMYDIVVFLLILRFVSQVPVKLIEAEWRIYASVN